MTRSPAENYRKLFQYYKSLGDRSLNQLSEEKAYFWSPGDESNSIAVIVQHMHGNMKSRWTDFLTTDGEKEWRQRDKEFSLYCESADEVSQLWGEGWQCLFEALDTVTEENIKSHVYIRNQAHTVSEAIERQLAHYAYHVGQIVFMARMMSADTWMSLSIPRGASSSFNEKQFGKGKNSEHFTKNI